MVALLTHKVVAFVSEQLLSHHNQLRFVAIADLTTPHLQFSIEHRHDELLPSLVLFSLHSQAYFFPVSVVVSQSDVSDEHVVVALPCVTEYVGLTHPHLDVFDLLF